MKFKVVREDFISEYNVIITGVWFFPSLADACDHVIGDSGGHALPHPTKQVQFVQCGGMGYTIEVM